MVLSKVAHATRIAWCVRRQHTAEGIGLPREVRIDRRYLNHEQVHALAVAAGDAGSTILFLAYTGVRFDEMAALRVRRVELARRQVEIAESVTAVNGRLVWGTPKGHARRWTSLPGFLVEMLRPRLEQLTADDLLFTAPGGGPLRASNYRRDVFEPAARAAGCPEWSHTACVTRPRPWRSHRAPT
jgi:integrase